MFSRLSLFLLSICILFVSPLSADPELKVISGKPALCEPSTVLSVNCPDGGRCVLIGDNEREKSLFLYKVDLTTKMIRKKQNISLTDLFPRGIEDIEALARMSDRRIAVFGSHSRNRKCRLKPARQISLEAKLKDGKFDEAAIGTDLFRGFNKLCHKLLKEKKRYHDLLSMNICEEIILREDYASNDKVQGNWKECKKNPAFNIEGAVAIKGPKEDTKLWIGLRAPVVHGKAVLIGLNSTRSKTRSVAFAEIDLGGHGVRALEKSGDTIWVVGGPEGKKLPKGDSRRKHTLWKFSQNLLKHGSEIRPEKMDLSLPEYTEGLAIIGKHALIVVDGKQHKKNADRCKVPGRYRFLDISRINTIK